MREIGNWMQKRQLIDHEKAGDAANLASGNMGDSKIYAIEKVDRAKDMTSDAKETMENTMSQGGGKSSNVYSFVSKKADQTNTMASNMARDAKETTAGPMSSGKERASDVYNYGFDSADRATKRTLERASDAKDSMSETISHGKLLSY